MSLRSQAQAGTAGPEQAQAFLFKLAKHFTKKVAVDLRADRAEVQFGFGHCCMHCEGAALWFDCRADSAEALLRLQNVLAAHLDLMTRRAPIPLIWKDLV